MEPKRSIFGPLLLIAAGVIWILIKSGNIPSGNLWALTHIWPYLLIAAGIGIMLKAYWKYTNIVLDVIIIGGAMLVILYAPRLGWNNPSMFSFDNTNGILIGPGVRGSGNIITQTREVGNFDTINVEYPAKILIIQGDTESVEIEADDDLLPELQTQVKNHTLEIFYKKTGDKHINPTQPVMITVIVKDLAEVDFTSAGELTIKGLKTDKLEVALSGAGNLKLNDIDAKNLVVNLSGAGSMDAFGTTDDLDVNISGFGGFNGAELHVKTANVTISGAGSATVWVDDELNAEISGAGSVNYYGSAKVTKQINGIGGVNQKSDK
jgi:hypothetical protein